MAARLRFSIAGILLVCLTAPARGLVPPSHPHAVRKRRAPPDPRLRSTVLLDGAPVDVTWNDGDTFKVKGAKKGSRVVGYNTLETYGAVHRWGTWRPVDLAVIAERAGLAAAAATRRCTSLGRADPYGRPLVSCPDAAVALVGEGLAMVYAVDDETPDARLLAIQARAQKARRGIWAQGVPEIILTSVHSADERRKLGALSQRSDTSYAYNRVVDTHTGRTTLRRHTNVYTFCDEVCETQGATTTCLVYLPFELRRDERHVCGR